VVALCARFVLTCSSLFFFTSRRRHTRSKRDWSSDVCSSDLHRIRRPAVAVPAAQCRLAIPCARIPARSLHPCCLLGSQLLPELQIGRASCRDGVGVSVFVVTYEEQ